MLSTSSPRIVVRIADVYIHLDHLHVTTSAEIWINIYLHFGVAWSPARRRDLVQRVTCMGRGLLARFVVYVIHNLVVAKPLQRDE